MKTTPLHEESERKIESVLFGLFAGVCNYDSLVTAVIQTFSLTKKSDFTLLRQVKKKMEKMEKEEERNGKKRLKNKSERKKGKKNRERI